MRHWKWFAALVAVCMLVAVLPVTAMAAGTYMEVAAASADGKGSFNSEGPFFEIKNIPTNTESPVTISVELYSGSALLCTKTMENKFTSSTLTCSFDTIKGTSSSWKQTPAKWIAYEQIVPTHGVLYVNGIEADRRNVTFSTEYWVNRDSTVAAPYMQVAAATADGKGNFNQEGPFFEIVNLPGVDTKVKVVLYSGNTALVSKERVFSSKVVTCSFDLITGMSGSWTQNPVKWTAYDHIMPTHAVLFINDVPVDRKNVTFSTKYWIEAKGTLPAPAVPGIPDVPKTGDETPIMAAFIMALLSLGMIVVLGKRKNA